CKLFFQMIGETEAEGDDGEGRVGGGGGDKAAGAGDIEVIDTMQFAIGVYDAGVRVVAHPGGAHVMPAAAGEFGPGIVAWVLEMFHELEPGYAGAAHLLADEFVHGAHAAFFEGCELPVEDAA